MSTVQINTVTNDSVIAHNFLDLAGKELLLLKGKLRHIESKSISKSATEWSHQETRRDHVMLLSLTFQTVDTEEC